MKKPAGHTRYKWRKLLRWSLMSLAIILVLPLIPYAFVDANENKAAITVPNPGAGLWRDVRQRDTDISGTTQVKGVDSGTLISASGNAGASSACSNWCPTVLTCWVSL